MKKWQNKLPKSTYTFKGWDWTELADCWDIVCPEEICTDEDPFADEKWLAQKIKEKIWSSVVFDDIKDPQVLADTYAFIKKVGKIKGHSDQSAVAGILKINHPWSFNKWVTNNLEMFWT